MRGGASDWLPDGTIQSYKELKQAFKDNYFRPAELRWKETGDLWNQTQGNFEKVEDFINRMRKSAKRIALDPGMLKDAVIHGLRPTLRMFVLQQKPGSPEETIRMAKVAEATAQPSLDNVSALLMEAMKASTKANEAQAAELKTLAGKVAALTESDPDGIELNAVQNNYGETKPSRGPLKSTPQNYQKASYARRFSDNQRREGHRSFTTPNDGQNQANPCDRCGYTHPYGYCSARGKICNICQKINHFASQCRSGRQQTN